MSEISIQKLEYNIIRPKNESPIGPITNPLLISSFESGPLIDFNKKSLRDRIISNYTKGHQHYPFYDSYFEITPEWAKLPNKKMHPSIPLEIKDFRFRIAHNRLFLGRQIIHIPNMNPDHIYCQYCTDITNTIQHLLHECPSAQAAWNHLLSQWRLLIGSFEDFIDEPIRVEKHHQFLGIETPSRISKNEPTQFNRQVVRQALDILLGNMQHTIIKQQQKFITESIQSSI